MTFNIFLINYCGVEDKLSLSWVSKYTSGGGVFAMDLCGRAPMHE